MEEDAADTGKQATKLLNDWQDISFIEITLVVLAAWGIILAARKLLPYVAEHVPSQVRLYVLGAVPITRLAVLTIAIMWIIPIVFNVTLQNFFVIAGAASVAVGFAFKDYLSSIIAGVVSVFERPYRPGDWVEIDGDYGEVQDVGLRSLQLRTADDNIITVPHLRLWDENVSNANDGEHTLMCVAHFHVLPGHDAGLVRGALRDVALTSAYLAYSKPVAVQLREEPWGTHYLVKAYPFDMRDQFSFVSDLTVRGKVAIGACGGREAAAQVGVESAATA